MGCLPPQACARSKVRRGHQRARSPAGFLNRLGGFARHPDRFVAGHDLGVSASGRIPFEHVIHSVVGISNESID